MEESNFNDATGLHSLTPSKIKYQQISHILPENVIIAKNSRCDPKSLIPKLIKVIIMLILNRVVANTFKKVRTAFAKKIVTINQKINPLTSNCYGFAIKLWG